MSLNFHNFLFVKYIYEEDVLEYFSFCQTLDGITTGTMTYSLFSLIIFLKIMSFRGRYVKPFIQMAQLHLLFQRKALELTLTKFHQVLYLLMV